MEVHLVVTMFHSFSAPLNEVIRCDVPSTWLSHLHLCACTSAATLACSGFLQSLTFPARSDHANTRTGVPCCPQGTNNNYFKQESQTGVPKNGQHSSR